MAQPREMQSQAKSLLSIERTFLFDDATSVEATRRLEAQSKRCGNTLKFPDGSEIVFDPMGCSVTASGISGISSSRL